MIFEESNAKWNELDSYVQIIQFEQPYKKFLKEIKNKPITKESINELIKNKWKVHLDYSGHIGSRRGICLFKYKTIELNSDLKGYIRDRILFHEIVHACYGEISSDSLATEEEYGQHIVHGNRCITEWLARQLRSEPEMLEHAVKSFRLEPYLYDHISYQAFCPGFDKQLVLSFTEEYFKNLKILMD